MDCLKKLPPPPPKKNNNNNKNKNKILKEHSKAISSLKSYTTATRFNYVNYASGDSGSVIVSR